MAAELSDEQVQASGPGKSSDPTTRLRVQLKKTHPSKTGPFDFAQGVGHPEASRPARFLREALKISLDKFSES
jgi:hypothetical protein